MPSASIRLPLSVAEGDAVHVIAPSGVDPDALRSLALLLGPVTTEVLVAYRDFGSLARNDEIGEILRRLEAEPRIRPQLAMWRLLAIAGGTAEDLAALLGALERWERDGHPRGFDCQIGRDFLRWPEPDERGVAKTLSRLAQPEILARLVGYPTFTELEPIVGKTDAAIVASLAERSSKLAAQFLKEFAGLVTPELERTFVRWKHRLSATSPAVAPIWVQRLTDKRRLSLDERLSSGFGVIDWQAGQPVLLVWPGGEQELGQYANLALKGVQLTRFLADATLRWAIPDLEVLPSISEAGGEPTEEEAAALARLQASNYRVLTLARWTKPASGK